MCTIDRTDPRRRVVPAVAHARMQHARAAYFIDRSSTVMKVLPTAGLEVRKSTISGKGCFATSTFARGRKIGELIGERISRSEAKRRTEGKRIIRCVEIDHYWRIDSR